MKKLLVTGNCQARPLTSYFEKSGYFECLPPIILHLARDQDRDLHLQKLEEADVILAQKTADNFALNYLRSGHLKTSHDDVVIWPNIFYSGQQPFLRYMTHVTKGRLFGPLDALHDLRIYMRWRHDRGLSTAPMIVPNYTEKVSEMSLQSLVEREAGCDVIISDIIRDSRNSERLFFTFNHPTNLVLWRLARRIVDILGEPIDIPFDHTASEALGRYVVPSTWTKENAVFRGDQMHVDVDSGEVSRAAGPPRDYSNEELDVAFFNCYDRKKAFREIDHIRLTPNMPVDRQLIESIHE